MARNLTPVMKGLLFTDTLVDGTAIVHNMIDAPLPSTVWVRPGSGCTCLVSYSTDNGVNYNDWSPGAVTIYTESVFDSGVTHLKVQRTAGSAATSTFGVC